MPRQAAGIHAQGIFNQIRDVHDFGDSGDFGIVLLHGHNVFNVFHILAERFQFRDRFLLLSGKLLAQLPQITWQLPAFGIGGHKSAEIRGVFLQQRGGPAQTRNFRPLRIIHHQ